MFRKYNFLFSLLFLLFFLDGIAQTNLISNGDFEDWTGNEPDNWTTTSGTIIRNQSDTSSGSNSIQIYDITTSQDATIESTNYNLEGGKTYILRLDVKMTFISGSETNDYPSINMRINRQNGSAFGSSDWHRTDSWEVNEFAFEVPENDLYSFEFKIANSSTKFRVQNILIDNVRLFDAAEVPENIEDRNALIALYNATDGPNWQQKWDLNESLINWFGITTNDNGRVSEIKIRDNNLNGILPPEIGDLEELEILDFSRTLFTGRIPNNFSGTIPPEIGNLTNLKELNLSGFELSGSIPPEIGQMSSLETLYLASNNLTGSIPAQLGNLSNLKKLSLGTNELTGNIPAEIGNLSNLENLILNDNELTGIIISELIQINGLQVLDLRRNNLTGIIPPSIGQMTNLNFLNLSSNNLTGVIPTSLGQLENISTLDLGSNNLDGTIPSQLGQLANIRNLLISRNGLVGTLPSELGQLTSLEILRADSNSLEGEIPSEFGALTNLLELTLSNNELSGSLPSSLGQLSSLIYLYLSLNNFSGTIPSELSQITTLNSIHLHGNNLSGALPIFAKSYGVFSLFDNSFIFEDLLNTASNQPNLSYAPQENFGEEATIELETGDELNIAVTATNDANNSYQWRKDGEILANQTNSTLVIPNIEKADIGSYDCLVTNSLLPDLTLTKNPIALTVDGESIIDTDNDGVSDLTDLCDNTPENENANGQGCSQSQLDDDNDGVNNNLDNCNNTPVNVEVNEQGCPVSDSNQINFLPNFSFEDWSGNPLTVDSWIIENANNSVRTQQATDGRYTLALDLNSSLANKTSLSNEQTVQLAPETAYTFAFDYRIVQGTNMSAELIVTKDGNPFGLRIAEEFIPLTDDREWRTATVSFTTNTIDQDHIFSLVFRANTSADNIIILDNMRVLGDPLPDGDNDGVLDANDQCPNTPPTALAVDENGCEINVDITNLIEDPSFEDWSFGGGANLANWGINLIPGSSWVRNEDVSDNLQYSVELTTGNNGTNTSSIFQNDIQFYEGVAYVISIDYKVLEGSFNTLELELRDQVSVFGETVEMFTVSPTGSGWNTFSTIYTPSKSEVVDLNIRAISNLPQERILLDNTIIRVNLENTDSDNDGVTDSEDVCPNTPNGESVDANGCSQSQLDDDGDGVFNNADICPNTPPNTTVDANGCALPNSNDADNDGIEDVNDSCPNTPDGESVDTNGCSQSQIDDDGDGVFNNVDTCPNTPSNTAVDANGCTINENPLPQIANDGIQVKVTSTSCPNTANGEISVSFNEEYNYTVHITGQLFNNRFLNVNKNDGLVASELPADTYTVCITIAEFPSYEQCFNVTIETPDEFISGKTVIDYTSQKAKVVVSGSKNYEVMVNDEFYSFTFNDSSRKELSFPLQKGHNLITIETDKICQGIFNDSVVLSEAILSPNPVADLLRVEGLDMTIEAKIVISNLNGVIVLQKSQKISGGMLEMNISNLAPGIYMLSIIEENKEINLKFVKK